MSPGHRERGAGTVAVLAIAGSALCAITALAPLSLVLRAKLVAAGAADAAALAAADAAVGIIPGPPCDRAMEVAAANESALSGCLVDGVIVTLRVTAAAAGFEIGATATAGPAPQSGTK